jgi:hypothetical protein
MGEGCVGANHSEWPRLHNPALPEQGDFLDILQALCGDGSLRLSQNVPRPVRTGYQARPATNGPNELSKDKPFRSGNLRPVIDPSQVT